MKQIPQNYLAQFLRNVVPASVMIMTATAHAQDSDRRAQPDSNVSWRAPTVRSSVNETNNSSAIDSQPTRTSSKPIFWNKSDFLIPFNVGNQGRMPKSVELEVSTDTGRNWNVVEKSDLSARQFTFRSNGDGLYWFRIKTIDESGRTSAPNAQPMAIVIDTIKPRIDLVVDSDVQARMVADFRIADSNLSGSDMRLEYKTELDVNWVPVSMQTQFGRDSMELVGKCTWEVPIRATQIVVRMIVRDLAGNESEQTLLPTLLRTAGNDTGLRLTSGPSNGFTTPYPANEPEVLPTPPRVNAQAEGPVLVLGPELTTKPQGAQQFTFQQIDPVEVRKSIPEGEVINNHLPVNNSPSNVTAVPPRQPQSFGSSSRAFSLDYNIEIDGANQVADVELWATTDQGRTWSAWGKDPDKASPFDIRVQTDGLFGFRMVVIGTNGLANNRPVPGDDADAWIQVDTQLPTARIQSAKYGQGNEAGNLIIDYTASDEHFSDRPIAFSYSENPDGPWSTIANEQPNNGRFAWPGNPNLPRRVYLRIEAYDQAGNVFLDRMEMPISLEGLAPRGRIQGFRPIPAQ